MGSERRASSSCVAFSTEKKKVKRSKVQQSGRKMVENAAGEIFMCACYSIGNLSLSRLGYVAVLQLINIVLFKFVFWLIS